jgi:hypothetical protein
VETVYLAGVLLALLYLMARLSAAPGLKSPVRQARPASIPDSIARSASHASQANSNLGLRRE